MRDCRNPVCTSTAPPTAVSKVKRQRLHRTTRKTGRPLRLEAVPCRRLAKSAGPHVPLTSDPLSFCCPHLVRKTGQSHVRKRAQRPRPQKNSRIVIRLRDPIAPTPPVSI